MISVSKSVTNIRLTFFLTTDGFVKAKKIQIIILKKFK